MIWFIYKVFKKSFIQTDNRVFATSRSGWVSGSFVDIKFKLVVSNKLS